MKAIILAAGLGTRLYPLTKDKPKCMVTVKDEPILKYMIDRLLAVDITKIIIVIGYKSDKIREFLIANYHDADITFVQNDHYISMNNIFSLWLARPYIGDDNILVINGDDIFNVGILHSIMTCDCTTAHIDREQTVTEDSMKVIIRDGKIADIGKKVSIDAADGIAIGLYRFSNKDAKLYFDVIEQCIDNGKTNEFYLYALRKYIKSGGVIYTMFTDGMAWHEIDDIVDYEKADAMIDKILEEERSCVD